MSNDVKPVGKNCELIIKELGIQEYAIGKSKVTLKKAAFDLILILKHNSIQH